MQTDIITIVTVGAMCSYLPIMFVRIFFSCRSYLLTGKFGSVDDAWFFGIMNHFHEKYSSLYKDEDAPPLSKAFKDLFVGSHPAGILLDGCMFTVSTMILGATTTLIFKFPHILGIIVAIGLFILLMRIMRKRIARKQEFIAKLEGTYNE